MKRTVIWILCLLLLAGCSAPAAEDPTEDPALSASGEPAADPTEAENSADPTESTAAPIIDEAEAPTEAEPAETLPKPLYVAEKCQDLLNMDYPVFLLAGIAIIENEYAQNYAPAEDASEEDKTWYERELYEIPYLHYYSLDLTVNKTGELMISYSAPTPEGNVEASKVFDLRDTGWEQAPTTEEAYTQLLDLAVGADGAYATACESLFSFLLRDDPAAFSAALSQRSEEEIQTIAGFISLEFSYTDSLDELEQIANGLSEENVKTALLSAIAARSA